MAKKNGLGRGLSALLGDLPEEPKEQETVAMLPVDSIDPNLGQPRKRFNEAEMAELAASVKQVGILQPILVARAGDRYSIIAGERRYRAARMAGLETVPAIVREMEELRRMEAALIENLQRSDLDAVEEAEAVHALMEKCGCTQEVIAQRLGKSRSAIANLLRIRSLPGQVLVLVQEGKLSEGHARALSSMKDAAAQIRLANLAVLQGWSVRQTERICAEQASDKPKAKPVKPRPTPEMRQLEQMAHRVFGTKARLEGTENAGKLVLSYYSAEDLQRIWDALQSVLPEE